MDSCIKNVDEEKWNYVKVEAAKKRLTMGKFFNRLVEEYKMKEEAAKEEWEKIFSGKAFLSRDEAENIKKDSIEFRKNFEFR